MLSGVDRWLSGSASHSSAQAVIAQTLRDAVPERALQIAADVGRWCSGCASGVLGAVDRCLSGPASRSSAQAVITQTLRDAVPERALQLAADVGRWCSGWASGVVGGVDRWLSGPAIHSSAQAVIAQTPRDAVPERALQIAADVGRGGSGGASGVVWCRGLLVVWSS